MENMADALKISFAVFVFVAALAIAFTFISKAKTTADVVLYHADKTNFYDKSESIADNRTVDLATVIAMLYKSSEESIDVTVKDNGGSEIIHIVPKSDGTNNTSIEDEIKKDSDLLVSLKKYSKYTEEFVEVPYTGMYRTGDDGTQITLSGGGKRVYVIYTGKE